MTNASPSHTLKIWEEFFNPLKEGGKTAEIRKNDRAYQTDQVIKFTEVNRKTGEETGRILFKRITHITDSQQFDGLSKGYVMISLTDLVDLDGKIIQSLEKRIASLEDMMDESGVEDYRTTIRNLPWGVHVKGSHIKEDDEPKIDTSKIYICGSCGEECTARSFKKFTFFEADLSAEMDRNNDPLPHEIKDSRFYLGFGTSCCGANAEVIEVEEEA